MTERNHHQHQRRPPDVEEALSSMLWTPYERTSTDSSSEDDDEKLNKRLRKSRSSYIYQPTLLQPSASAAAAVAPTFMPMTTSYFGCDDFLLPVSATMLGVSTPSAAVAAPTAATPFVPFSNLMISTTNSATNGCHQHYQQHQQQAVPPPATITATNYHKNYDAAASTTNYRFSYPYYGPIPSLTKWWSSSTTAAVEPPSYESLYAKNATMRSSSLGLKPVLKSLKASITSMSKPETPERSNTCNSAENDDNDDDDNVDDNVRIQAEGRLVHSFTDNFITENCTSSAVLTPHKNSPHPSLTQAKQQQHTSSTCHDQLHVVNNVDKPSSAQVKNINQNDVTAMTSKSQRMQCEENNKNNNNHQQINDNDDDTVQKAHVEQVNQPTSVAAAALSFVMPAITTTITTTNTRSAANSTSRKATSKQMNSNSPTTTTTRTKTTTTTTGFAFSDSATTSSTNELYNDNTSDNNSFVALSAVHQPTTTISSSRAFTECGSTTSVKITTASFSEEKKLSRARKKDINVKHDEQQLTPNKCLAELERLRAKIRAGESKQRERQQQRCAVTNNMRLNIPATVAVATQPPTTTTTTQPPKIVPTTSSVFLTTTNNNNIVNSNNISCNGNNNNNNNKNNNNCAVAILTTTTTSNSCPQQPSLTIQVNNNNNNSVASSPTALPTPADFLLNESIINNNNGISVVNCSYVECKNGSVAKSSAVNNSVALKSSAGVSVNNNNNNCGSSVSSSSVPNVLNSSSSSSGKRESAANILQSYPNNNYSKKINVANAATTTTTITNRDSVNIININSPTTGLQQHQRRIESTTKTTTPSPTNSNNSTSSNGSPTASPSRTFTSTQCQTDDFSSVQMRAPSSRDPNSEMFQSSHPVASVAANSSPSITTREQRRRERRERRHQQQQLQQLQHVVGNQLPPPHHHHHHHHQQQQAQLHQLNPHIPSRRHSDRHSVPAPLPPHGGHLHPHAALFHHTSVPPNATMPAAMAAMLRPMLPDILHSHFPPPYSALGGGASGHVPSGPPTGPPPRPPPPPPPPSTLLTPVISTLPIPGATTIVGDGRFTIPLPMIRRTPSERSGKGCCGQWFAGPPLRALIAVVALGGVACALGGAALGATGLAGPPSSHFTAALLMIGVGVVLVTVSGAAWRMTAPGGPPCLGLGSSVDLGRCGRRPCSRGGGAPHGLLYPEFQHRPPPPSYQASMQEYRLRLLLLDRDRQNGVVRGNSPPPTYRSHAGSLLRAPLTTTLRGSGGGGGSIGGSEYSLPPSYRSRNTTPATICSERSIETAPSGRLLANEVEPEPLSAEQLPGYSSLQHLRQLSDLSLQTASAHIPKINAAAVTTPATATTTSASVNHQMRTSAIVEVVATNKATHNVGNDKITSCSSPAALTSASVSNSSAKGKELVTIVTISQNHSDVLSNEVESNAAGRQQQQQQQQMPNEQMEILAHL